METKHIRVLFFVTLLFLMFGAHGHAKGLIRGKGCFKDSLADRVLPVLLFARGQNKMNWHDLNGSVINKCKEMAIKKNYKCFGIQYYGECWSGGEEACQSFKRLGQSSKCVCSSDQFSPFVPGTRCLGAVGKELTNYVYEILD